MAITDRDSSVDLWLHASATEGGLVPLTAWHNHLHSHFLELRRSRSEKVGKFPIFALEHGLSPDEIQSLSEAIRQNIAKDTPSKGHALPWIVYAVETGYHFEGGEYWQTFEANTPGWEEHGDREWIRDRFKWFARTFGGARPAGPWAKQFTIISWPITHAVMPSDLQHHLAKILYELRGQFTQQLLKAPEQLGELIESRSWCASSRFQLLAQEHALVGQIAVALLLEGKFGHEELLLPATLQRIGGDLQREQSSREWLTKARSKAQEQVQFNGLKILSFEDDDPIEQESIQIARDIVTDLGIEPRLVLRPTPTGNNSWDVMLKLQDLSHLLQKFPDCHETLTNSRCTIAGTEGRPLARGQLLYGTTTVKLNHWPRADEPLLRFEHPATQLDYLLRAECLLRPGTRWLFRVASDGLAYELRSLRVRPGQRYILLSNVGPIEAHNSVTPLELSCKGVHAASFALPVAIDEGWSVKLKDLNLIQAKNLEVWPTGIPAAGWDGEGRSEWLSTDYPCIALRADHQLDSITLTLSSVSNTQFKVGSIPPGECVFIELPKLSVGFHTLRVQANNPTREGEESVGDLELLIREPKTWDPENLRVLGNNLQGALNIEVDPESPTMEQLWEGQADIVLRGPVGKSIECIVTLIDESGSLSKLKIIEQLRLPSTPDIWRRYFETNFLNIESNSSNYCRAKLCEIEFNAGDLGKLNWKFGRQFSPLCWVVKEDSNGSLLTLVETTGSSTQTQVCQYSYEEPNEPENIDLNRAHDGFRVEKGGMFVAHQGDFSTAVVLQDSQGFPKDPNFLRKTQDNGQLEESAICILQCIGLWSGAQLLNNNVSAKGQRDVLHALLTRLFSILAGPEWANAETSPLIHAVRLRKLERLVASDVAEELSGARAQFARISTYWRLEGFSKLMVASYQGILDHSDCEFALRLASDPATASAWADKSLGHKVRLLIKHPVLARAARFLVLALEHRTQDQAGIRDKLYPGWDWR